MSEAHTLIRWYQTENQIKNDPDIQISISEEDIEQVRKDMFGKVPEERLAVISRNRKLSSHAKELLAAQTALCKTDFYEAANLFLSSSIENSLESKEILLNIFALVDKRVGKKRLLTMAETIKMRHPIVQYFYKLRCNTLA